MNSFDHLRGTYFQECAELLESAYGQLAAIEEGRADGETIHAIFRAIHSIKGGGGAFGFTRMVAFAHVLETLLDLLRDDKITLDADLAGLLLRSTDALSDLVAAERDGIAAPPGFEDQVFTEMRSAASLQTQAAWSAQDGHDPGRPAELSQPVLYRIRFLPHASLFRNANEPLLLIRELKRLGQVSVTALLDRLPSLESVDPENAYFGWTIDILTDAGSAALEEVFEFVVDHCELLIVPLQTRIDAAPVQDAAVMPAIVRDGHAAGPVAAKPADKDPPSGPEKAAARVEISPAAPQTVRVDVDKIDRLVNLVGELVINQAMLVQLGGQIPSDTCPGLINGLDTLSQHLRELQDGVMAIRTQPVKSVFSRMPRLVRELSAQLRKEVRLVVTGEATEIDKTIIEQLADPLTHLLRNALDHGIEFPEQRTGNGKPPQGIIHLAAEHRGGRIVIEVSDDGQGINRERVLSRARERGLIPPAHSPGEEEIDNLIFLPGFSTAQTVSDISGRGVGMDVVKRNIQALGGRVTVQSRTGAGSRFILSLPLTLAILDGMIVAVGRESYIVPLTNIIESLRPKRCDIHAVAGCGHVVAIRDRYVPLIYLARHFSVPNAMEDPSSGIVVVVETESAGQVGLVVDELVGQQQVVVKSLEANYGAVRGIGGATILGNGRVALILDIAGLRDPASAASGAPADRVMPPPPVPDRHAFLSAQPA